MGDRRDQLATPGGTRQCRPHLGVPPADRLAQAQDPDVPRPVVTLDSGYDLETLAHSTVDADLLVRLAKHRVVYHAAERSRRP